MRLKLDTVPAEEPVEIDGDGGLKKSLRIDGSDFDTLLTDLIKAARIMVEEDADRALVTQTWDLTLDAFPGYGEVVEVPRPPLQGVTSITYVDGNGDPQTWDSEKYRVDNSSTFRRGRITPVASEYWPTTQAVIGAVTVKFVAGYGDAADVPQLAKWAIMLAVAASHKFPTALIETTRGSRIQEVAGPMSYKRIIRQLKAVAF